MKKKIVGIIAFIVCIGSAVWLVSYMQQSVKNENQMNELKDLKEQEIIDYKEDEQGDNKSTPESKENTISDDGDLAPFDHTQPLEDINKDYVGWITIEGTKIDYPVVQAMNNLYYLDHDFYTNESPYGTPFLDTEADINNSQNLVIYAHNMSDKQMFTDLLKYEEQSFYEKNKIIQFAWNTYEIFAAARINLIEDAGIAMAYTSDEYFSQEYFLGFIEDVKKISSIKSDIEINEDDRILCLSTCTRDDPDERFVVFGKLIEEEK